MKSRVRAYKNRAKWHWVASEQVGTFFCYSQTLKTSFFPLSIRLLFGAKASLTIKRSTTVDHLDSYQE